MPRYSLRTLLILLGVGPPILAALLTTRLAESVFMLVAPFAFVFAMGQLGWLFAKAMDFLARLLIPPVNRQ